MTSIVISFDEDEPLCGRVDANGEFCRFEGWLSLVQILAQLAAPVASAH